MADFNPFDFKGLNRIGLHSLMSRSMEPCLNPRVESNLSSHELTSIKHVFQSYTENCLKDERAICQGIAAMDFSRLETSGYAPGQATLKRNPILDAMLFDDLQERRGLGSQFRRFQEDLPVYDAKKEILDHIRRNRVTIISGETGSGKTTQIPQYILDDMIERKEGSMARILVTQPRRISAITVAQRVGEERGETISQTDGKSVGYQIRHENFPPRENGSILFCTTGIILHWLRKNPRLEDVSHVILDEVHERDMMTDFIIVVLKQLLHLRSDFKLILMSASLDAEVFSKYFDHSPVVHVEGRSFRVTEMYLDQIVDFIGFQYSYLADLETEETNLQLVAKLVHEIHRMQPIDAGAILVFLTGWEEQEKLSALLTEGVNSVVEADDADIYFLHSLMDMKKQRAVFLKSPEGRRKIILSTNIGETSITIDDVVFVVDTGKINMTSYDPAKNMTTLKPEWVSRSNAKQRAGRAGRVREGFCYHLFTRAKEARLLQFVKPEILRTSLEDCVLNIASLKLGKAEYFLDKCVDKPSKYTVIAAVKLLLDINALVPSHVSDDAEELTSLGSLLSELPISPMLGKMVVLGAIFSCLDPILTIACVLAEKDIFVIAGQKRGALTAVRKKFAGDTKSDHIMLARVFKQWEDLFGISQSFCKENCLNEKVLESIYRMKHQLTELLQQRGIIENKRGANFNCSNENLIRAVVGAGLYPNVARASMTHGQNSTTYPVLSTATEHRVNIHMRSVNAHENLANNWMVYFTKMTGKKNTHVHDCSKLDSPIPLLLFGGRLSSVSSDVDQTISIDGFVKVKCDSKLSETIIHARKAMDLYLVLFLFNISKVLVKGSFTKA